MQTLLDLTLWHLATQEYFSSNVLWQVFYSNEQHATWGRDWFVNPRWRALLNSVKLY